MPGVQIPITKGLKAWYSQVARNDFDCLLHFGQVQCNLDYAFTTCAANENRVSVDGDVTRENGNIIRALYAVGLDGCDPSPIFWS
jgi:hypothetical protein